MIELLKRLCTAKGVSGREENVCKLIKKEISSYADEVTIDKNNNVIARIGDTSEHNIMLDAHLDEVFAFPNVHGRIVELRPELGNHSQQRFKRAVQGVV